MEVVARLSHPLLAHLRVVLADEHELIAAPSWSALGDAVRRRPADVVIADPRADGWVELSPLEMIMQQYPALPVVVYTSLSPESLQATVALAKRGLRHVVLRGFDDEPRRFRALLAQLPATQFSTMVWNALAPCVASTPPLLGHALARLFESPHECTGVVALAQASGMSRRSLDRWLLRVGLAPARRVIFGARLARAAHFLREPEYSLEDVARKVGARSARRFARQVRAATGRAPTALRDIDRPDRFAERLVALLRRPGASNASPV